jgi:hypothetical protein
VPADESVPVLLCVLLTRHISLAFVITSCSCTLMRSCELSHRRAPSGRYENAALYGVDRRMASDGRFRHVLERWPAIGLGLEAKMVAQ